MHKELREFYKYELEISNARIKYFHKIIERNPEMSSKTIDIINRLKYLYIMREKYFENRVNNKAKINESVDLVSTDNEIRKLEYEFRKQQGSSVFTYQNKFVKLLTLLTQLLTKNNSKKLKDDINQILKELYNSKQITKQVYNILNKALMSMAFIKNDS